MTALTPHIRVLRAEAEALVKEADRLGRAHRQASSADDKRCNLFGLSVMNAQANAKWCAADALEAEERALEERLSGPQPKGH